VYLLNDRRVFTDHTSCLGASVKTMGMPLTVLKFMPVRLQNQAYCLSFIPISVGL
jgi:hypothetical protein